MVVPRLSFAATADGAVADSIGKFETYLLNRLVSGMPQSGRGALQDLVARRGTYIEALLGGTATFDLTLELFSDTANTFGLEVLNLPAQIGRSFRDPASGARLSQIRFTASANIQRAALEVSLPDRPTAAVPMDSARVFYAVAVPRRAGPAGGRGEDGAALSTAAAAIAG